MKLTKPQQRNYDLLVKHGLVTVKACGSNSLPGFNQTALASLHRLGLVERATVSVARTIRGRHADFVCNLDVHTYTLPVVER